VFLVQSWWGLPGYTEFGLNPQDESILSMPGKVNPYLQRFLSRIQIGLKRTGGDGKRGLF